MSALAHPTATDFVFDAFDDGWRLSSEHHTDAPPCIVCHRPAWLRDPQGRPRHRVDCAPAPAERTAA